MCEPNDDWPCTFNKSLELEKRGKNLVLSEHVQSTDGSRDGKVAEFKFSSGQLAVEDDDEVT